MPKRKTTYKVDSSQVQGDGSWVELSYITYGEFQTVLKDVSAYDDLLRTHVLDWNWADGEGNPMPAPQACMDSLFAHEREFLLDALYNPTKGEILKN